MHTARDIYPRFSPDGRSIAFSSDREGNMDVYVIPTAGGAVKRLTIHSADDTVLDWTPDGKGILFASQRGEDFMGKLYVVSVDGGMPRDAGPDMGVAGSYSPDGTKLAVNRKAQSYWRKYYRGAYQSDVTVMDLASKTFKDVAHFRRHGLLAALEPGRLHLLRQRPRRQGPDQHLAEFPKAAAMPSRSPTSPAATSAFRA